MNDDPTTLNNSPEQRERELKSRGAGVIFYVRSTDQLMFFLRDDKPGISCPNMIDIIGGHMEDGETPEVAALREVAEELKHKQTDEPFVPDSITHFNTFVDDRPGEHNIFTCELDAVPDIYTTEGQGLVLLTRAQASETDFAYGYNQVVREYLDSRPPGLQ
jgi:8-oxo-dGTP pyrophosphatase MutT (NUDIX family)